jgi:hypothetical protein
MIYLLALVAITIALLVQLKYLGIKKRIDIGGVEITRLRTEVMNFRIETKSRDYNARKRDENLLREIRKSSKWEGDYYGSFRDLLADNNIKMDGIAKLCRGIENVARSNTNNDTEIRAGLTQIKKCQKEAERILKLFEETLEKAKKTGRGK